MKLQFSFILICAFLFSACEKKIDENIISGGSKMDENAKKIEQNLDKNSYMELADLFLDTGEINFDKEVLIIFGRNNCQYCDLLKADIKKDSALKAAIKEHFNPYYINISYTKIHNLNLENKKVVESSTWGEIFGFQSTPTIAFFSKNGKVKYLYPGYTPQFSSMIKDVINKNEAMGNFELIDKKIQQL